MSSALLISFSAIAAVLVWGALKQTGPSGVAYLTDEPHAWYWIEQRGPGPSDLKIGERQYQTEADAIGLFERWIAAYPTPGAMLVLYRQEAGGGSYPLRIRGT